jgi:cytochrome c556
MSAMFTPAAVSGLALSLGALASAQQPPSPTPLVPVAASTLAADPSPYFGQHVTLMAAVERRLSPHAFSVDQDRTRTTGHEVLILTRALHGPLDPGSYVTVIGEVVRFDPGDIAPRAPDFLLDLSSEVLAAYRGRVAVLATSVINAALVDLARRLPPPMTADEEAYDRLMKRIGPAFTALRQAVAAANADAVREHTAVLTQTLADTESFWRQRAKADAAGWSRDARTHLETLTRAAAGGQWDAVKTAATGLQQTCANCHGTYRERVDDGSYRMKAEAR